MLGSFEGEADASALRPRIDIPKQRVTVSWRERLRLEGCASSRLARQHLGNGDGGYIVRQHLGWVLHLGNIWDGG